MKGLATIKGEFVEWSKKTEQLSEDGGDDYGNEGVPDKKTND